jgi:hypothetical protein
MIVLIHCRWRNSFYELLPEFSHVVKLASVWIREGSLSRVEENTAQLVTLFALSNLWMVLGKLMGSHG